MERARYQFGSLTRKKRAKGSDAWEFRYYESTEKGSRLRKTTTVGTVDKYKNKALAQKAVEALLLKLNSETPQQRMAVVTFGATCDRYIQEEIPERYSTSKSYRSNIKNHLKPRWSDYLLIRIRPMAVEDWLKKLPMAPKSRAHIRSVMHLMFECATRWELFTEQRNYPTSIQKRHIQPAGCCVVACPTCGAGVGVWCSQDRPTPNGKRLLVHEERQAAAGKYSRVGWHTFRHTYRSWLDETGAPMKVQQELMRHASIQTTIASQRLNVDFSYWEFMGVCSKSPNPVSD